MIRLYPEQLVGQLNDRLFGCYILAGSEQLLAQESIAHISHAARQHDFMEQLSITVDSQTDWQAIFNYCQDLSLFSSRKILKLQFIDHHINAEIANQLSLLASLLHADILFILYCQKISKAQENSLWFKSIGKIAAYISCQAPEPSRLPRWVALRAKSMALKLDQQTIQHLCYCYEGNLLALSQALTRLSLIYHDRQLTLIQVAEIVDDSARFTPYQWLDALLAGKTKRAWHILQQLKRDNIEPLILIRTLQKDLLQLVNLHREMQQVPIKLLFDQQKIWQNRRQLFSQALQRLSKEQLQRSVSLLSHIELTVKQNSFTLIWLELENLLILLCTLNSSQDV